MKKFFNTGSFIFKLGAFLGYTGAMIGLGLFLAFFIYDCSCNPDDLEEMRTEFFDISAKQSEIINELVSLDNLRVEAIGYLSEGFEQVREGNYAGANRNVEKTDEVGKNVIEQLNKLENLANEYKSRDYKYAEFRPEVRLNITN